MSEKCCSEEMSCEQEQNSWMEKNKPYFEAFFSLLLLLCAIYLEYFKKDSFSIEYKLLLYGLAYLIVGRKVVWKAIKMLFTADLFNEFFLMTLATIGAFAIGKYAEGVTVMLFYSVGELFQDAALNKANRSIESLLKLQIDRVILLENGNKTIVHPNEVNIGQTILVKVGDKVALDGELISSNASFNTAALTGESVPVYKETGDQVLAGMINLSSSVEIKVTSAFEDTKLSKILKLVREASSKKAKTQNFISKFAKVYTPIVVFLALGITLIPFLFVENYVFEDWLYRALVFLVVSCPCALVISIPLGYFGGIGAASKNGILFKGSNYLELITKVDTVILDKTGTLTKGVFEIQKIISFNLPEKDLLEMVALLESHSTHPIAKAISERSNSLSNNMEVKDVREIAGLGLIGIINGKEVIAGNSQLLKKFNIPFGSFDDEYSETTIFVAIDNKLEGVIIIADQLKEDAHATIEKLRKENIQEILLLSGDRQIVVDKIAKQLGLDKAFGELLPEDKVKEVLRLQKEGRIVIFVGDGVNDAPAITSANVGIAMGAIGSDAAIETADVVIQTDHPSKIVTAIKIGRATKKIVWQNIGLAFGIKLLVLILGAGGIATMWEAVFADVGVAFLAILNAVRIQKMNFH